MVREDRGIMRVKALRRVQVLRQTREQKLTQVEAGTVRGLRARGSPARPESVAEPPKAQVPRRPVTPTLAHPWRKRRRPTHDTPAAAAISYTGHVYDGRKRHVYCGLARKERCLDRLRTCSLD